MAEQCCNTHFDEEQVGILSKAVKIMTELSEADSVSAETLCFGHLIEAYKR